MPDFVDIVFSSKSTDSGLIAPDRRVFLLVKDVEQARRRQSRSWSARRA